MSGENVQGSMGDGQSPDIEADWLAAKQRAQGKRVSIFRASTDLTQRGVERAMRAPP